MIYQRAVPIVITSFLNAGANIYDIETVPGERFLKYGTRVYCD